MAEQALSKIQEAESQAQALIRDAREQAAEIIGRAEEEAAGALALLSEACGQQALENKRLAQADNEAASAAFAEETKRQCAALREELLPRKALAVAAVVEGVA
ncbi:MAG: hypothetical protein FWH26_02885 [Oscillospiraceae bacterium]|nr:hypothetical protein [Oscillospiraceae bacterium]